MPVDADALFALCDSVKAAIEDYYADPSVPEEAFLPDRRYVSDGLPAYDDAQLTVHVNRTFSLDDNGNESANFPIGPLIRRGCELVVTLLRGSPVVDTEGIDDVRVPTPEEIEESARVILADPERLADALVAGWRNGDLPGCAGLFFAGWQSYGPEGGLAGGVAVVRALLD